MRKTAIGSETQVLITQSVLVLDEWNIFILVVRVKRIYHKLLLTGIWYCIIKYELLKIYFFAPNIFFKYFI